MSNFSIEAERLKADQQRKANWKRWGCYLSERQWATVREDYSPLGENWDYFSHEQARSRAYRWGEDGLLGFTDRECRFCFALALWNGKDRILKERLFGLTSKEGNHGEDVKECYYYLDGIPSHSYMKGLYKYSHSAFPYEELLRENQKRNLLNPEFEILETKIFDENRYFDVFIEYSKNAPDDILIRIQIINRGKEKACLHILPTIWFRNTWSWKQDEKKPHLYKIDQEIACHHATLGKFIFSAERQPNEWLFTENETNHELLFHTKNESPYVKDAFHRYIIHGEEKAINPKLRGTKAAPHYIIDVEGKGELVLKFRLFPESLRPSEIFGNSFDEIFANRIQEADQFYQEVIPQSLSESAKSVSRQAYAGLLWTKQFYHFVIEDWLKGDPSQPKPPSKRKEGRNNDWNHFFAYDVLSVPDKWEYPWFAAWDSAFHMIPFAKIDPDFAKKQLILFLREWYMHPNGQQPAYEFSFSDVNPPVHAWSAWRVYKMTGKRGQRDRSFLESVFQKLLMNFTWWLNRKDLEGKNIFGGGFLGLDNIGIFNRSNLPVSSLLEQADGTSWMAFYCLTMLSISLELAQENAVYEDIASKFFEHFVHVSDAINCCGGKGLWNSEDGFYYDLLKIDHERIPLKVRSLVGLIPLIAVEILEEEIIQKMPGFTKRMNWFLNHRKDLELTATYGKVDQEHGHRILAISSQERLKKLLHYMCDENEFLSPYGIRSLSKYYQKHPYKLHLLDNEYYIDYSPGDSTSFLFGGNSNWRGPIWFPLNFLIIEALERYHHFYGDAFLIEYPTFSGQKKNLKEVASDISSRLIRLFLDSSLPIHKDKRYRDDPHFKDLYLFYEFFHADEGLGLGASHQTGWTALVAKLLEMYEQH